jgi:hypothetical protein
VIPRRHCCLCFTSHEWGNHAVKAPEMKKSGTSFAIIHEVFSTFAKLKKNYLPNIKNN